MNNTNKLLVAALVALAFAVPTASAVGPAPNSATFVQAGDVDIAYTIVPEGAPVFATICFVDLNGDTTQQPNEPAYLHRAGACGKVVIGDVRLTDAFTYQGGSIVSGSHDDFDRTLLAPATANIVFFDADGNGAYNIGDRVAIHFGVCGAAAVAPALGACGTLAISDILLTGANAFDRVTATTDIFNVPLSTLAAAAPASTGLFAGDGGVANAGVLGAPGAEIGFFNADGEAGYSTADTVYMNARGILISAVAPFAVQDVADIRLTALGTVYAAGTQVAGPDVDTTTALTVAAIYAAVCAVDTNADGVYGAGEPIFAVKGACAVDNVASGDLRIVPFPGFMGGSLVKGSDDDFARDATLAVADFLCFYDIDGSGSHTAPDVVFLDVTAPVSCANVQINDILISGANAWTQVARGDSLLNRAGSGAVAPFPGGASITTAATLGFFDADGLGAVITSGDYLYLDADASGAAGTTVNDVRMTAVAGKAAGTKVSAGDVDLVYVLAATAHAAAGPCYVDANGNGVLDNEEAVYLQLTACGTNVGAGSVRLFATGPYLSGSIVKGGDDDTSRLSSAAAAFTATYTFYDVNGNGIYNAGETIVLDRAVGAAVGSAGDIQMTVTNWNRLAAGNALMNAPLAATVAYGTELSFNADGVGGAAFTTGDALYLDLDASASVTVGDVRVTSLGGGAGAIGGNTGGNIGGTGTTSPTTSAPTTSAPTTSAPTTSAPSTSAPAGTTSTPPQTPGFELVALVAALGAALVLVRRKL